MPSVLQLVQRGPLTCNTCAVYAAAGAGYLNASSLLSTRVSMTRIICTVDAAAGAGSTGRL